MTIENVIIYHAFMMNFNLVKSKLCEIKKMGFTHVQVGPIHECREKFGPGIMLGGDHAIDFTNPLPSQMPWWFLYQPKSYKIGNAIVGTENEFKELIAYANNVNIGIIVDIVIGHTIALDMKVDLEFVDKNCSQSQDKTFTECIKKNENKKDVEKTNLPNIKKELISIAKYFFKLNDDISDDEILNIFITPFICDLTKTSTLTNGYDCWLGRALPHLNYENVIVRNAIHGLVENLGKLGVSGIRVDAAGHINPDRLRELVCVFKENCIAINKYSYIEVVDAIPLKDRGKTKEETLIIYKEIAPITEYKILEDLKDIFCFGCNVNKLIKNEDETDLDKNKLGVVFSATHDTDIQQMDVIPELRGMGFGYNKENKRVENDSRENKKLALIYLIQQCYGTPLVLWYQTDDDYDDRTIKGEVNDVKQCIEFRDYLFKNKVFRSKNTIVNSYVFKSMKYNSSNKHLGTIYINISGENQPIDGILINPRRIKIVYPIQHKGGNKKQVNYYDKYIKYKNKYLINRFSKIN